MSNLKRKDISVNVFSCYRKFLMGIATIMIVMVHSSQNLDVMFPHCDLLQRIWISNNFLLYGGVDLFLLISGLGLYYSMENNCDIKAFYKKRMLRILPELLCVIVVWNLFSQFLSGGFSLYDLISDVFLLNFILDGSREYWFFNLILLLYLIYPLIHHIYNKFNRKGFYILLLSIIAITFVAQYSASWYPKYEVALTRIPAFLIGAWIGRLSKKDIKIPNYSVILAIIINISSWIYYYAFCENIKLLDYFTAKVRYIAAAYAISLAFILSVFLTKIKKGKIIKSVMWFGGYSLEFYLLYERVVEVSWIIFKVNDPTGLLRTVFSVLMTMIMAVAFKFLIDKICSISKNK